MPKSKFNIAAKLIVTFADDSSNCTIMEFSAARDRFVFYVNCDLELGFSNVRSIAVVVGKHKRFYYESNHHLKHVNF